MFLYKKHQSINNYTIVFPHKEGSYAETYRVKDSQGNLRFLKLINTSKLHQSQFDNNGKIIVAEGNLMLAIDIANEIAPEHLELCVDNPFDYLDKVKHAGSIFMGKYCPEALGDYFAGPNHTLPTSGTARFSSPLSVDDFVKKTQFTYYTENALEKVADKIAFFAHKEGLDAHAKSATIRFEEKK